MIDKEQYARAVNEATDYIRSKVDLKPTMGIILGTGLGSLVDGIEMETTISYDEIPHFPVSTVESHHGKLLFGKLRGKDVVCMQGRFHFYEGYNLKEVTFPVRVMKRLGIDTLIVSNAAGGLDPLLRAGDIMLITDHINFFPGSPLIGPNDDGMGMRFPDMYDAYAKEFQEIAREIALEQKLLLREGIYVGVTGPTLETAAEYRMFRILGADAVGMSTVPEVVVARHQGTRVLAFSIITDMGLPDNLHPCSIEEVLKIAAVAEPKLRELIAGCVERM